MQKSSIWTLTNGATARAVLIDASLPLTQTLAHIGLQPAHSTLTIVGGAGNIADADLQNLQVPFFQVLAPLAQSLQAMIIDGGTNSGIMGLIGQARSSIGGTFPLIGVLPAGKLLSEGGIPQIELLEPHHSHFILAPGTHWGDESPWLARVASELAGSKPALTLLANGGDIAWQDVGASIHEGHPVVVLAGSGRTADVLAQAVRGYSNHQQARALVDTGLIHVLDIHSSADEMMQSLLAIFKKL